MVIFWVLIVIGCGGCLGDEGYKIPILKVKGSHYEALKEMSSHFKEKIVSFVENYDTLKNVLIPWYNNNTELYNEIVELLKKQFPNYYDEIKGIADGSGVDFYKVFLLNTRMEIQAVVGSEENANECTDIHVRNIDDDVYVMGHNEDGNPNIYEKAFLVDFDITDDVRFMSYCYPAIIPGNAYSWNEAGLVFGGNALQPKEVVLPGIPRMFLYRHSVAARSIEESINNIVSITDRSFGVSINIGDINNIKRQVNYEFSPSYFGVVEIKTANFSHMNNYKYLDIEYINSVSTVHRQARVNEFPVPKNAEDVSTILGDTKDPKYPIYNKDTLSTAIFKINEKVVDIYSQNPHSFKPIYSLPLTFKNES